MLDAAAQLIEALKAQPAVLALIVIAFGMLGYLYYQGASYEASRRENVASVLKMQSDMARLIQQCVQPTPTP